MASLWAFWGLFFSCLYVEWASEALLEVSGCDFGAILVRFERFGWDFGFILRFGKRLGFFLQEGSSNSSSRAVPHEWN